MLIAYVLVVFISSFLLAATAVMVASVVLARKQPAADGALELSAEFEDGPTLLKLDELSSITLWDNLLNRFDFVEGMRSRIVQSELSWSVGRLTSMMLLLGAFSLAILSEFKALPFWMDFLFACAAAFLPYGYVLRRRAKKFRQFEQQFPGAEVRGH